MINLLAFHSWNFQDPIQFKARCKKQQWSIYWLFIHEISKTQYNSRHGVTQKMINLMAFHSWNFQDPIQFKAGCKKQQWSIYWLFIHEISKTQYNSRQGVKNNNDQSTGFSFMISKTQYNSRHDVKNNNDQFNSFSFMIFSRPKIKGRV